MEKARGGGGMKGREGGEERKEENVDGGKEGTAEEGRGESKSR